MPIGPLLQADQCASSWLCHPRRTLLRRSGKELSLERHLALEDLRNVVARLHSYHGRQRQGRSTNDHFRARRVPINGSSIVAAIVLIIFDDKLRRTWQVR